MSLRGCTVIAIEGTHAAGKTTLVHALAAAYGLRGVHVGTVEDPARSSPLIDEIVIQGRGDFDLAVEVDEDFCRAWAPVYDAVFISNDCYPASPSDPYRNRVTDLQTPAHHAVRAACQQAGLHLIDIPAELELDARVAWIASRVDRDGLTAGNQ